MRGGARTGSGTACLSRVQCHQPYPPALHPVCTPLSLVPGGRDQYCGVLLRITSHTSWYQETLPRAQDPSHTAGSAPGLYQWVPLTFSALPPCARQLVQCYRPRPRAPTIKVLPLRPAPPLLQTPPHFSQEPRPSSDPAPSPNKGPSPRPGPTCRPRPIYIRNPAPEVSLPSPPPASSGRPRPSRIAGTRARGRIRRNTAWWAVSRAERRAGHCAAASFAAAPGPQPSPAFRSRCSPRQVSPARSAVPRPRSRKAGGAVSSPRGGPRAAASSPHARRSS